MYIVSGCLLGKNCKYNGGNNRNEKVLEFLKDKKYVEVCPESAGGLKIPRPAAEIKGESVINKEGVDVTYEFILGAKLSLEKAINYSKEIGEEIEGAILKANSPSCGSGKIYDGSFSKKLIDGDGIFARVLKDRKIKVITENEL